MKTQRQLTPSAPSLVINLENMIAGALFIQNPTGSAVVVRVGGSDVPSVASADHIVPANGFLLVPVDGTNFAAGFVDTTALGSAAISNLQTTAKLLFLSDDELLPNFGSASFQSLSLSELTSGLTAFAGSTTSAVFDIGSWGGALIYVAPSNTSGQILVIVEAASSAAPASWSPIGTWSAWSSIPAIIQAPRTVRYLRVRLVATTIAGEAAIAGNYAVRATIAEILTASYTPVSTSIVKALSLAALGSVSYFLATAGLRAISVGVDFTTGSRAELIAYAGPTPTGPWRTVAFREQIASAGGVYGSIYRTYGNLDLYTRIDVLEIANVPMTGTVAFSMPFEPDLNGIEQAQYAALGDVGQPVNVRQSIYHQLDAIYTTALASIDARLVTINTTLGTINTSIGTTNTSLATVNTNLTTINASLTTSNSWLSNISSFTSSLVAALSRGTTPQGFQWSFGTIAGTNYPSPAFLAPGFWAVSLAGTCKSASVGAPPIVEINISSGSNAVPLQAIHRQFLVFSGTGGNWKADIGPISYNSIRSPGFLVPAGHTTLWANADIAGTMVLDIMVPLVS